MGLKNFGVYEDAPIQNPGLLGRFGNAAHKLSNSPGFQRAVARSSGENPALVMESLRRDRLQKEQLARQAEAKAQAEAQAQAEARRKQAWIDANRENLDPTQLSAYEAGLIDAPPINKGDRKTAKDASGRLRYLDDGSFVFDNVAQGGHWTPEKIAAEYDLSKYTPESVQAAIDSSDPKMLQKNPMGVNDLKGLREGWKKRVGPYEQVGMAMNQLKHFIANPGPISDVAAVYNTVKLFDPTSVVREGEIALMNAAAPIWDRAQVILKRASQGGAIGEKARIDLAKTVAELGSLYQQNYDRLREDESLFLGGDVDDPARVLGSPLAFPTEFDLPDEEGSEKDSFVTKNGVQFRELN